jgi:RNase P subunit RPR2
VLKEEASVDVDAYCMKCKTTRKMKDAQEVTMENGRRAAKGTCPECGTKMTKFLPSAKASAT